MPPIHHHHYSRHSDIGERTAYNEPLIELHDHGADDLHIHHHAGFGHYPCSLHPALDEAARAAVGDTGSTEHDPGSGEAPGDGTSVHGWF